LESRFYLHHFLSHLSGSITRPRYLNIKELKIMFKTLSGLLLAILFAASAVIAQDAQLRSLTSGQKYKIKGAVVAKDDDNSFVVRDTTGVDTRVVISPEASIKSKGGLFGGGDRIASNQIVRGLYLEVEGRGDNTGNLAATKVRFDKDDFKVAQSIDSRVGPAEARLTAAEENAQRVSGQIDELMAISNAARGGAKAAQETADAAIEGVNATNNRITAMDDYVVQSTATVNFRVNSARLSPEAKASLDEVATAAATMKGYVIEITGFASAEGGTAHNKVLSQRRAQAVIDYLVETHNVPLRRIGQSYGFGELQAVADNTTREGREQNRRVEVKLLVSRGINQNVEVRPISTDDNE
jgi:outer membrane protein OmpA-like peptidoglycan-associated protein